MVKSLIHNKYCILPFIFFGVVGIIVVTVGFKIFTYFYLKSQEEKIKKKQNGYWNKNYVGDMAKILFYLYKDVSEVLESKSIVEGSEVEKWIKYEILPTAQIDWTIWIGKQAKTLSTEEQEQ